MAADAESRSVNQRRCTSCREINDYDTDLRSRCLARTRSCASTTSQHRYRAYRRRSALSASLVETPISIGMTYFWKPTTTTTKSELGLLEGTEENRFTVDFNWAVSESVLRFTLMAGTEALSSPCSSAARRSMALLWEAIARRRLHALRWWLPNRRRSSEKVDLTFDYTRSRRRDRDPVSTGPVCFDATRFPTSNRRWTLYCERVM